MQPLAGSIATTVYLFMRVHRRPRMIYDRLEVRKLLHFSGYLLGSNVLSHVTKTCRA